MFRLWVKLSSTPCAEARYVCRDVQARLGGNLAQKSICKCLSNVCSCSLCLLSASPSTSRNLHTGGSHPSPLVNPPLFCLASPTYKECQIQSQNWLQILLVCRTALTLFIYCRSGEEGFNPLTTFSDCSAVGAQNAIFAVTKVEFCMQRQGPRSWGLKNTPVLKALW